jgi:hypothetical protein
MDGGLSTPARRGTETIEKRPMKMSVFRLPSSYEKYLLGPETDKSGGPFCFTVAAIGNKRGFPYEVGLHVSAGDNNTY